MSQNSVQGRARWKAAGAVGLLIAIAASLLWAVDSVKPASIPAAQAEGMNSQAQASVAAAQEQRKAEAKARRTVFIGDSYTQGTGSSSDAKRWATVVSRSAGWLEVNLGRGGTGYLKTASTAGCGKAFCPNYDSMVEEAVAADPSRVIVAGGQNDFKSDFADVEPMITKTYSDLRAALPNAELIAVGPSFIGDITPQIAGYDAAVHSAADAVGAKYISLIDPDVLDPSMAAPDGVHVDDSGHAAIAKAVIAALGIQQASQ